MKSLLTTLVLVVLLLAVRIGSYAQGYADDALLASNTVATTVGEVAEDEKEAEAPRVTTTTASARVPMMTIQGRVIDVDKDPLVGATIMVEGTQIIGITDADGCYKLTIPAGRYTLRCGSAGYYDDEVSARPTATNQTVVLKYRPDAFKRIKR
ncbi:carboxypeptidase-like regulatory domain-containing protein [Hymenobacter defluvii]|uniref:Carboxypeptidase-like regulatory domain-containing protein n=1 Tax=Hymenobacter defluvii TaxID=2054411 RepID=A0ABS3T6Y1_9BACT|nr:carboxypeptidase-like regulatory domain-containing protein [Hymenobacter defluvii]MBO3269407.1 carboxypeptidase-like regulatory domain-containing protein [Hymenobacter defluvii]